MIYIPVHGQGDDFGFGVWVSQKKENFQTYRDNYDSDQIGPFFGWLSTRLICYADDTFCLKTMAYFRGANERPSVVVEPTDHRCPSINAMGSAWRGLGSWFIITGE